MRFEAVVFDLFGTLVESYSYQGHEKVLSEMAEILSAPTDDFARVWLRTFPDLIVGKYGTVEDTIKHLCSELGLHPEADLVGRAARLRFEFSRNNLALRQGAIETLRYLKSAGYKTGLISDCTSELPTLWKETPIARYIDVAVFSWCVHLKKPDPRIYLLACERLDVPPQSCLYVGDGGSRELSGAAGVGMHPVLIRPPGKEKTDVFRVDTEEWKGPAISKLADVLLLLE